MLNPARAMTVFGIYRVLMGLCCVLIPNILLPVLGFPTTTEVWIRVVGLLVFILGFYYLYSARYGDRRFYRATVFARVLSFTGLTLFASLGLTHPILVAFGVIDLLGAAWTALAIVATT